MSHDIQGVLLAAGFGRRFDPTGRHDKLLQPMSDDRPLLAHAASRLAVATPGPIAIIRPGQTARRAVLEACGCRVLECAEAERGMGHALAAAVRASAEASGWLVALGDMPAIPAEVLCAVAQRIDRPDACVAPFHAGRRGHPVGFGAAWYEHLCRLQGDAGARALIAAARVTQVACTSPGIFVDVDTPADLDSAA
ncbi:nucleotidyltransferase family protein [Nitrogeniibacter mangrovi]|uniref:Nucleotidyltransferase family protein n=1 Tax=Nitrogeniibacter mangrovi TaxID=2016596 RepID=A0A6C1B6I8_9RHOO|nr:nucleotidyltransferase family protein [Nitrogeniibacter mangrovi]QID17900.1 nucleotidyltransferase family protein [Nitrogeniibacter mangrovi]